MNLLLPAPVAATLIGAYAVAVSIGDGGPSAANLAQGALLVVAYAYFLAIIPSLLGALWMEGLYRRGHAAGSARALVHSGLWGAFSGAAIAGYFFRPFARGGAGLAGPSILVALGAATGLVVGWLVGRAEKRAVARGR
jgi:hypothetical protein